MDRSEFYYREHGQYITNLLSAAIREGATAQDLSILLAACVTKAVRQMAEVGIKN